MTEKDKADIAITALVKSNTELADLCDKGFTPLTAAIQMESVDLIKALIECGADVNQRNSKNISPVVLAVQKDRIDFIDLLSMGGADLNLKKSHLLHYASSVPMIRFLVSKGVDPNERWRSPFAEMDDDHLGTTAMHNAVWRPNGPELIHALLDAGADMNAYASNYEGRGYGSPLHEAIAESAFLGVVTLLELGAELDFRIDDDDSEGSMDHLVMTLYPKGREDLVEKYVRLGYIDRELKDKVDARLKSVLCEGLPSK